MLEAKNIAKSFGDIHILRNISLCLKEGESFAITGKSGRGKTTLLYLLSGLDRIDRGEIFFNEKRIDTFDEKQLSELRQNNFGFIFQHHFLLNELTAFENALLPLRVKNTQKTGTEKVYELFEKFQLSDRLNHYPETLSGGEAQRVAIIRALISKPKIIFADEPTGSLDEDNASVILETLFSLLKTEKISIIMSTHNMNIAKQCEYFKTIDDLEG